MREIIVGKKYKHFKGHVYIVKEIGYNSETYNELDKDESKMVVYEDIERHIVWIRPYEMFNSKVDKEKYPEVNQEYRFEEV